MELQQKVKTALDETRMLILGGQILLGFELRGVFADTFDQLPAHSRYLDAVGLGLMVVVIALLIAPEPYHRFVEGGSDSGAFHDMVTGIADIALLPFALALGVDVLIGVEPILGRATATAGGILATAFALGLWYGLPRLRRSRTGARERAMADRQRDKRPETPLHTKIEQLLTEGRVILPGAQALFGFQLAIVLTQSFEKLPSSSQIVHAASIGFVALSVVLLMAPAAYHRIVFAGEDCEEMHRVGGWLITAATLPLALGLAGDLYVVIARIAGGTAGLVAGIGSLVLLLGLWYVYPLIVASCREHPSGSHRRAAVKPQRQSG